MSNEITKFEIKEPYKKSIDVFDPEVRKQILGMCQDVIDAGIAPKWASGSPNKLMIVSMYGAEVGLSFLQSISGMCVINGVPSMWGDVFLGFCLAQPTREYIEEWVDTKTDTFHCISKRKDRNKPIHYKFSWEDAKRAGLKGKTGPWSQYPTRMMQMRPRGWSLRDNWADKLRGIQIYEEAVDHGGEYIPLENVPINALSENKYRLDYMISNAKIEQSRIQKILDWAKCNTLEELNDKQKLVVISKLEKEFPEVADGYIKDSIKKIEFNKS